MPIVERGDLTAAISPAGTPGLVPVEYSSEIIQRAVEQSAALSTFRRVTMPSGVQNLPVLDALPAAQWVTGEPDDTGAGGEKATTSQVWKGVVLTAEEIAAIVVIPEAVLEDSTIDLWGEITPRLGESIGAAVDAAAFSGTNKPTSWPAGIIPGAVAAGNGVVAPDPSEADYNEAFGKVEEDGFMVDQVYAATGQISNFRGFNAGGVPIYLTDIRDDGRTDSIYGVPVRYDRTGYLGTAHAVVGDPNMAILGVRRDLQFKVLDQAMIDVSAAGDGSAMVNLAQQDSIALRVRARFGFAVANPTTMLQPTEGDRYPFGVVTAS